MPQNWRLNNLNELLNLAHFWRLVLLCKTLRFALLMDCTFLYLSTLMVLHKYLCCNYLWNHKTIPHEFITYYLISQIKKPTYEEALACWKRSLEIKRATEKHIEEQWRSEGYAGSIVSLWCNSRLSKYNRLFLAWFKRHADPERFTIRTAYAVVEGKGFCAAIIVENRLPCISLVMKGVGLKGFTTPADNRGVMSCYFVIYPNVLYCFRQNTEPLGHPSPSRGQHKTPKRRININCRYRFLRVVGSPKPRANALQKGLTEKSVNFVYLCLLEA